jgi:putative CocE/NonD family hydrolase
MGSNVWRNENEFPLARTVYTNYYLNSDGLASANLSSGTLDEIPGQDSKDTFTYDPAKPVKTIGGCLLNERSGIYSQNSIELRNDVLKYSSKTLESEIEITGPVELILYVSTDAINTDFTAKLCDVYPDGNSYNLAEGIVRKSYIDHEICKISIQLNPISNVFLKGHKIRLEISSSNYPRYSRNFNTGNLINGTGMKTAKQNVYTGSVYSSCLILPVIPNK